MDDHKTDLVSVIIPVYNVKDYLARSVESIIRQTYQKLEIILVDDGSTDGSEAICDFYAANNSNITVVHQPNKGVSSARNSGIDIASGKYISFVDADDLVMSNYIEVLYTIIRDESCDISVCGVEYVARINESNNDPDARNMQEGLILLSGVEAARNMLYQKGIDNGPVSKLYSRAVIGSHRFNEDFSIAEDLDFNYRLFMESTKIGVSPVKSYMYWQRAGSAMRSIFSVKRLGGLDVLNRLLKNTETNRQGLSRSVENRIFIEAVLVASEISFNNKYYSKDFNECLLIIQNMRINVFKDRNSRMRYRLYAGLSIISVRGLILLFVLKKMLKGMRFQEDLK